MPTQEELRDFFESSRNMSGEDRIAAVKKKWSNKDDQLEYFQYSWAQRQSRAIYPQPPAPSESTIYSLVKDTNFTIENEREKLQIEIDGNAGPTYLPLGTDRLGQIYRVLQRTDALVRPPIPDNNSREILPSYVIGINTSMLSKSHRKELSEESTISNETDDIEDGGFVGFQLGLVEVFEGDDIEDPAQEDAWSNTGFAVVVKISLSGCAVGLYLVYDFYQEDVHSGNMSRNIKTDDLWGYLPNFEERFGSAKVVGAESFDRIEFGLPLEFSDVVRNEVNLVHVVVASNGTIIRGQVASQVSMPEKGLKREVEEIQDEVEEEISPKKR